MVIKKAAFVRSLKQQSDYIDDGLPEIAVAGKSNVGKSSLINMLTNNGRLARVSKQPGKTRLVNFFRLNDSFMLADLPGYGFAKVSKEEKCGWDEMMTGYFAATPNLKLVLILMDIRHKPTAEDLMMVHFVEYYAIPYAVVATKADKIAKSKRSNECARLRRQIPASFEYQIIPVSSEIGYGKDALLETVEQHLNAEGE